MASPPMHDQPLDEPTQNVSKPKTPCSECGLPMSGAFVRALGTVYHLDCFRCKDCNAVVASKFFPIDRPDGKQVPLCERDYFRRINLLCAKCGSALRGSYITAMKKKYHVEHFTCSICPTLFGPQDSYYEHDDEVYCHFHYSTRLAVRCKGCRGAILKQFVEINRNGEDQQWHPECYMINKFWNVVISPKPGISKDVLIESNSEGNAIPSWVEEERNETPESLKSKQKDMDSMVYRIWTVLSRFEESSAATISDMLRHISNGNIVESLSSAQMFVVFVEALFACMDEIQREFLVRGVKGMSHIREARMLCKKTVDLFTLISRTGQPNETRNIGMTQELLALVTGIAHYLKILIRIALTGALKIMHIHSFNDSLDSFLLQLQRVCDDGADPNSPRDATDIPVTSVTPRNNVAYGFDSLKASNIGSSPFRGSSSLSAFRSLVAPTDLCVSCGTTVEESAVRLGGYQRWHFACLRCRVCGKDANDADTPLAQGIDVSLALQSQVLDNSKKKVTDSFPVSLDHFVYCSDESRPSDASGIQIFCIAHAPENHTSGFESVTRLEQYAFLLNVALRRLAILLKKRGQLLPTGPSSSNYPRPLPQPPRIVVPDIVDPDRGVSDQTHSRNRLPPSSSAEQSGSLDPNAGVKNTFRVPRIVSQRIERPPILTAQRDSDVEPPFKAHFPGQVSPKRDIPTIAGTDRRFEVEDHKYFVPGHSPSPSDEFVAIDLQRNAVNVSAVSEPDQDLTLADIPDLLADKNSEKAGAENSPPYIASLTALELLIVKHAALLGFLRSPLLSQSNLQAADLLGLVEIKKDRFWGFRNVFKGIRKKGLFGLPLEALVEKDGTDSNWGASSSTLTIPTFLHILITELRHSDLLVPGIFPKFGLPRYANGIIDSLNQDPLRVSAILNSVTVQVLSALLKRFLMDLPEPLMTSKLSNLFLAAASYENEDDQIRCVHILMLLLPKAHRDTVEVLLVFFKWFSNFKYFDAKANRHIGLQELAVIFGDAFFGPPSVFYAATPASSTPQANALLLLLEKQDTFLRVPEELKSMLEDREYFEECVDSPSKEILKRCDSYMKVKSPTGSLFSEFSLTPSMFSTSTTLIDGSVSDGGFGDTLVGDADSKLKEMTLGK